MLKDLNRNKKGKSQLQEIRLENIYLFELTDQILRNLCEKTYKSQ